MRALLLFLIFEVGAFCGPDSFDWAAVDRLRASGRLQLALELVRSLNAVRPPPVALKAVAAEQQLLHDLARYREAQSAGRRWIALATKAGDARQLAEAEHRTGKSFSAQHKNEPAAGHFRRALEQLQTLSDADLQFSVLVDLAGAESNMSRYASADGLLERAEALWRSKRDPLMGARLKLQRAWTLHYRGEASEALPVLEEALALAGTARNSSLTKTALTRLGQIHISRHQYAEALAVYRRVLSEEPDPQQRAVSLVSIGICEFELNQLEEATRTFEEALRSATELGSLRLQDHALGELGLTVWKSQRDGARAIHFFDRAIAGFEKSKDPRNALAFLENKALVYRDQGRFEEALRLYRQVERRTRQIPGQQPTPNLYKSMGQCLVGLGRLVEGEKLLRASIEKAQAAGDTKRVWQGFQQMARLHRKRQELGNADDAYRRALEAIESMRQSLSLEAFKADFFEDKVQVYEEYAGFLVTEMGGADGIARAFAVAERARARSFLDSLAESRASVHETLPEDIVRAERAALADISSLQGRLRMGENTPPVRRELSGKEKELEQLHLRIRSENPRFRQVRYPQPVDYPALRKALRPDELVLEYLIGEEGSHAWVASANGLEYYRLPARAQIERAVRSAYAHLLRPGPEQPAMEDLSRLLLGPIAAGGDGRSLIIIPSGILYYFPFEVLPVGPQRQSLVNHFRISYMPSASTLVEARGGWKQPPAPARLLALGDPVDRGKRDQERGGAPMEVRNLEPLPHTRREVEALGSLFGRRHSTILLGERATERNLKQQDLRRYSVIHLAAHGWLDSSSSARSGLVLGLDPADASDDGILQVREVYRLRLQASLVTLSACQSALGRLLTGEGMVGLSRAFFYAGAEGIVASLWNVNDDAAAEFMSRFYRRLKSGASKAEALRQAKLSMPAEGRYRHPYYWASYILIGDGADGVAFPRDWSGVMVAATLLALVVAAFFYRRRRRRARL